MTLCCGRVLTSGRKTDLSANNVRETIMNNDDEITIPEQKDESCETVALDQFEAARGKADIKWRTDELMALLRDED
ncbi:hypothetical protein AL066_20445 [Pseudomonas nunensis]|nr:hypothetical protein AL066_20445 [Pseudomonas nunensis]